MKAPTEHLAHDLIALRHKEHQRNVIAGIVVIGIAILIGLLAYQHHSTKDGIVLHTILDRGYKLEPGSQVMLSDVSVGTVEGLQLLENNRVRLSLRVKPEFQSFVRVNTVVTVGMDNPFQNAVILLSDTSPGDPVQTGMSLKSTPGKDIVEEAKLAFERIQHSFEDILQNTKIVSENMSDSNGDWRSFLREMHSTSTKLDQAADLILGNIQSRRSLAGVAFNDTVTAREFSESVRDIHRISQQAGQITDSATLVINNLQAGAARVPVIADNMETATVKVNSLLDRVGNSWFFRGSRDSTPRSRTGY